MSESSNVTVPVSSRFSIFTNSNPVEVRHAIQQICRQLRENAYDSQWRSTVELVLAESMNNISEHAYCDTAKGVIRADLLMTPLEIRIELRDSGRPLPNGQVPLGSPPKTDVPLDELPEGGFGWFVIRRLTRKVAYERMDGENCLRLWIDEAAIRRF